MNSTGYGDHPTIYGGVSDSQLYGMYRGPVWSGLDESHRQQLLQETVNRAAAAQGQNGACRVVFADLEDGVYGAQSGSVIRLNREMFVIDTEIRQTSYGEMRVPLADSNMTALETALHENEHAWQNQCIRGEITGDPALTAQYRSNDFTTSSVTAPDGSARYGSQYMYGDTGYFLYYFQSTERDAHKFSQERAVAIMESVEREHGTDPSFAEYRARLAQSGYEATLQKANSIYGTNDFERSVNHSLMNHYYHTNLPVEPGIDDAVKNDMIRTYEEMHSTKMSQKENDEMADDQKHISIEEYDQTLHDQVNAFYTHAVNDPSISHEEAVRQTSEMAENYLEAVEEFQAEAEAQAQTDGAATDTGTENGTDGGTDGGDGMDGGIE